MRFTNRLDIGIGNCANDDKDYYFGLNKIEDANSYNKYIRYNVNSKDIDEVEVDQYGVEYPFFLITPFRYPGTAVSYNGDKLEFKPVKNNPHQRFNLATLSNYCILILLIKYFYFILYYNDENNINYYWVLLWFLFLN